jgi:hypothetical protein
VLSKFLFIIYFKNAFSIYKTFKKLRTSAGQNENLYTLQKKMAQFKASDAVAVGL